MERRPYIAETTIAPGTACVQGSAENKTRSPLPGGGGDFIGVYAYEAREAKAAGEALGVTIYGVAKVLSGGNVSAGSFAEIKDESGAFVNAEGGARVCGMFLQNGTEGEYVELFVAPAPAGVSGGGSGDVDQSALNQAIETHNSASGQHSTQFAAKEDTANKDEAIPASPGAGRYPTSGAVKSYVETKFPVPLDRGGTGATSAREAYLKLGGKVFTYNGNPAFVKITSSGGANELYRDRDLLITSQSGVYSVWGMRDRFNAIVWNSGTQARNFRKINDNTLIVQSSWCGYTYITTQVDGSNRNIEFSVGTQAEWDAATELAITDARGQCAITNVTEV